MVRLVLLTSGALLAFAGNSLLGRLALGRELVDPASFTLLRLASGTAVLMLLARRSSWLTPSASRDGSWGSGLALFAYALAFSWAYLWLEAGTGALLLFGAVQVTMVGAGLAAGERLGRIQWLGLATALGGLSVLVWPGLRAPEPRGAVLMVAAGVAWGVYSLRGRAVRDPVGATTASFLRATPFAATAVAAAALVTSLHVGALGVLLAVVSGALASALGYVLWYAAVPRLTAARAAVVQLLVPVLAAGGGVVLLAEAFSARLGASAVLVLGGVAMAVLGAQRCAGSARREP